MERIAFFDVGGTLIEGHVWDGILSYSGIPRWRIFRLYTIVIPLLLLRRLYLIRESTFRNQWAQGVAALLRGISAEEATSLFTHVATYSLLPQYRPDVVVLLNQRKAKGYKTLLVSGVFSAITEQIAEHLGADGALGSILEIKDNHLTGQLTGATCIGPRKIEFIRKYLAQNHPDVELADCAAYTDSFSEMTMLKAVGEPTAVYPDEELLLTAQEQGWPIHPLAPTHSFQER